MPLNRSLLLVGLLMAAATIGAAASESGRWTTTELGELQSRSLSDVEPLPADRTIRVTDESDQPAARAPYMHAGQFAALREVVGHYNRARHTEVEPLRLRTSEIGQLEAFVRTLSGPTFFNGLPVRDQAQ